MAFHCGVGIHIPQRLRHIACTEEGLACLLQQPDRRKLLVLKHLHHLPRLSAMTAHIGVMGLLIEISPFGYNKSPENLDFPGFLNHFDIV